MDSLLKLRAVGVLLAVALLPDNVQAQKVPPRDAPFPKANAVLIFTSMPADSALLLVTQNLRQRGFEVQATSNPQEVLSQPGIEPSTEGWPLMIRAEVMAEGIRLTGRYQMPELPGRPEFPAEFKGFDWSPAKRSFQQVEKTASVFRNSKIQYVRY